MKARHKLLVIDDNHGILSALRILLKSRGYDCDIYADPALVTAESLRNASLVMLDMNFKSRVNNGNEGLYWLSRFVKDSPSTPVVLMTAYADIELAVRGIKEGAADFVVKPWSNEKLMEVIESACSGTSGEDTPKEDEQRMIVGESPAMQRLMATVEKIAPTDANILITGENGTGKGILAAEIHRRSLRYGAALTTVDVGAIPESLLESELFGNVKGAYTGAVSSRAGKIESADGGTLFLDEITNLPLHLQSKLLSVLQTRSITRIGDTKSRAVDVRLISATNRDIASMVAAGEFREDLYYRINTICIELPPLRERREEIEPLVSAFAREFGSHYGKPDIQISDSALQFLRRYDWPGNIRQLRHAVEKAVIMCDSSTLTPGDFAIPATGRAMAEVEGSGTLAQMERRLIVAAMAECGGNLSAVAAKLGITRQTLYNKIKKFGL